METFLIHTAERGREESEDLGQKAFSKSFYVLLHPTYFPSDSPSGH